jgi:hypothetical protein
MLMLMLSAVFHISKLSNRAGFCEPDPEPAHVLISTLIPVPYTGHLGIVVVEPSQQNKNNTQHTTRKQQTKTKKQKQTKLKLHTRQPHRPLEAAF